MMKLKMRVQFTAQDWKNALQFSLQEALGHSPGGAGYFMRCMGDVETGYVLQIVSEEVATCQS